MNNDELILDELRRIRIALERQAPKRWQRIPLAAKTLDTTPWALRQLIAMNKLPIRVMSKTKIRKAVEVDTIRAREIMENGMLLRKVK